MSKTFIIAEAACTWLHGGLESAYRSIRAAKECGADAWKTQWTSDPEAMAMRRGVARDKYTRLGWAQECLPKLKHICDEVGIELMVTCFIPKDIPLIAPYVSRFKVSAFESKDTDFVDMMLDDSREVIISGNPGALRWGGARIKFLHCVSEYPTPPEKIKLSNLGEFRLTSEGGWSPVYQGISDHTVSTLTGAVAVGSGRCSVIEKHVRLSDTPSSDPDYGHSLCLEGPRDGISLEYGETRSPFKTYVDNIREAERML